MVKKSVIDTASNYVRRLSSELEVKKAFLFGSCAKGLEREDSDIDIAVVFTHMTDFFSIQMQLMRLRRKIDIRIEPHPISEADFIQMTPFAYEIKTSGIEIEWTEKEDDTSKKITNKPNKLKLNISSKNQ